MDLFQGQEPGSTVLARALGLENEFQSLSLIWFETDFLTQRAVLFMPSLDPRKGKRSTLTSNLPFMRSRLPVEQVCRLSTLSVLGSMTETISSSFL